MRCYRFHRHVNLFAKRSFSSTRIRLIDCNSCGISLQNTDPKLTNYYRKPEKPQVGKLESLDDIKYLLFSQDIQHFKESDNEISRDDLKEAQEKPPICKRCSDALYQNKYTPSDFQRYPLDKVLKLVKPNSSIANVVPLHEFPFHFNAKLLKSDIANNLLILTKGELSSLKRKQLSTMTQAFFIDFLKYHVNIITNRVVGVSALKSWNLNSALSLFKNDTYLLGNANVGKSKLINSLLDLCDGYKVDRDTKIRVERQPSQNTTVLENKRLRMKQESTGVSFIPNLTRNVQAYKINAKYIYDLPGYTENLDDIYLEDVIKREWLEGIRNTSKLNLKKLQNRAYDSLNGTEKGRCYTIGGIFFLVPPNGTINQITRHITGTSYTFSSVEKGIDVFKECHENELPNAHSLQQYCAITKETCDTTKFNRHVIPPFLGAIEIVFKDIGYIRVVTTGRYKFAGLHEIWVPKGIEVCIREPLEATISSYYYKHIKNNTLACPVDRPIISSTYIMDHNEKHVLEKMREMYLQRTEKDIQARRLLKSDPYKILSEVNPDSRNLYWYYNF
ncbi:hypothetical protein TPHA_0A01050 [Tetrapisispora phaffii CBS 4417]|uniref:Genetic interactor of prohibitins 3, mitochondrial n=1 Tax=Tetrapisispora phaffii (strain ATCC 24235 / CBS 4417 / NBRC 1672 / NRRL Y-8282 / UCD 70-5) TaxID=1071381 RepID=G8BMR2_TETPH|nr:hypothetical protein TPHA_0A01050 [Tetrapisispora phaffii CBS 4417]CCE61190.1 hypothetical protein TPHA_0A01050 [Tetrapisispora phaffii CBS 4417]